MSKIVSLHEINQNPWGIHSVTNPTTLNKLPPIWREDRKPNLDDILLWEQLYESKGTLSVYAAFSPRAEIFIIVPAFNAIDIETFYNEEDLIDRLRDFKIRLRDYI